MRDAARVVSHLIPYRWKRRAVLPLTGLDYLRAVLILTGPLIVIVLLLLLLGCAAKADTLPDAPKPKPSRVWVAETVTLGALYASDWTLTSRGLGEPVPGGHMVEYNPVLGPHPSNLKIALYGSALFSAEALVLHRTEKSKHAWVRWGGRIGWAYFVVDEVRCIRSWKR